MSPRSLPIALPHTRAYTRKHTRVAHTFPSVQIQFPPSNLLRARSYSLSVITAVSLRCFSSCSLTSNEDAGEGAVPSLSAVPLLVSVIQ